MQSSHLIATEMATAMSSFVLRSRAFEARADCAMLANAFMTSGAPLRKFRSWRYAQLSSRASSSLRIPLAADRLCSVLVRAGSAGGEAEQAVGRAVSDHGRNKGNNADPADPVPTCIRKSNGNRVRDQDQADNSSDGAIDYSNIHLHWTLLSIPPPMPTPAARAHRVKPGLLLIAERCIESFKRRANGLDRLQHRLHAFLHEGHALRRRLRDFARTRACQRCCRLGGSSTQIGKSRALRVRRPHHALDLVDTPLRYSGNTRIARTVKATAP